MPKNPVIVEAGAHKGIDTLAMNKNWPNAMIYAFEPIPQLFDLLSTSTQDFRNNIKCYQLALGEDISTKNMYVSSGKSDASSSLLPPVEHLVEHPDVTFNKVVEIQTISLDQWAKRNDICFVDFLWLDMQGYEFNVLSASPNILKTVQAIYTEVSLVELYKGSLLYPQFRDWLENQGFIVKSEYLDWKDAGNVLFVRL
ncbi:MAG: FkbM family methyltransferase [Limnothrix sp. RL_2_0]|nr:FkbM family methyltransferase [Limnothrix sp. RL_2_0]